MKKILVVGAGMVGGVMAVEMSNAGYETTLIDYSKEQLLKWQQRNSLLKTKVINVNYTDDFKSIVKLHNLVICAVPGFMGFDTLKNIIECGVDVVDISFFPEDSLQLNDLAIQNNCTAIVDCGVAPGMSNLILGYCNKIMKGDITNFECYVGGLPKTKKWPFYYKAPFSPIDVIEEYTRKVNLMENGKIVVREPLSDCEYMEFENVGTLEAFNSDGLRTLLKTMSHIPNMKEKTLRFPGHVNCIKILKESGFFDTDKLIYDHKPLEFTSKILFKEWKLNEQEEEFTVMRVVVKNNNQQMEFELYDEYDVHTDTSSMARTTGYVGTAIATMLLEENKFGAKGVFPPEMLGSIEGVFDYVMDYLKDRNVIYSVKHNI